MTYKVHQKSRNCEISCRGRKLAEHINLASFKVSNNLTQKLKEQRLSYSSGAPRSNAQCKLNFKKINKTHTFCIQQKKFLQNMHCFFSFWHVGDPQRADLSIQIKFPAIPQYLSGEIILLNTLIWKVSGCQIMYQTSCKN